MKERIKQYNIQTFGETDQIEKLHQKNIQDLEMLENLFKQSLGLIQTLDEMFIFLN